MLKDLVVFVGERGIDEPAFKQALALAQANGAHLVSVVGVAVPLYQEYLLGAVIYEAYQAEVDRQTKIANEICEKIKEKVKAAGVDGETRALVVDVDILPIDGVVHARYADLVVMSGRSGQADARLWERLVNGVLFGAGRPILIVPEGVLPRSAFDKVVIGWNASREATRAVHDGMSLIRRAHQVDIVVVDPSSSDSGHGQEPGADLAAHLVRHGGKVNVHRIPSGGKGAGTALQQFALDAQADVLVMGAYGHSRVWETLLGGATRDIFADTKMPVLISH